MKIRKGYCTKIVAVCITALAIAAITGSFSRLPAQESKGENPGVISLGSALSRVDESNQYALIVGINLYDKIGNLNNAVLDAKELKRILVNRYRYAEENIIQLYDRDATQVNIESALRDQVKKLTPVDNLLVYFSGHGHLDRTFGMGFWLPSNIGSDLPKDAVYASEEELINASSLKISNSIIQGMMKNCRAHHIFVVADACFAGHLLVEKGYKKKQVRQVQQEETAYRSLQSGISLEGYLDYVERYPGSVRANLESFADGFVFTAPVTAFSEYKSPYGQVNMAGNAAEWIGVSGKGRRTERRLKGGGYLSKESALKVKAAEPAEPGDTGGFRCIREETGEDIK